MKKAFKPKAAEVAQQQPAPAAELKETPISEKTLDYSANSKIVLVVDDRYLNKFRGRQKNAFHFYADSLQESDWDEGTWDVGHLEALTQGKHMSTTVFREASRQVTTVTSETHVMGEPPRFWRHALSQLDQA